MSELAELIARRDEVLAELQEIESLSADGVGRILEAVKAQRWKYRPRQLQHIIKR